MDKKATRGNAKRKTGGAATTADILGMGAAPKSGNHLRAAETDVQKIKPKWRKNYRNLLRLREELVNQMDTLTKDANQAMDSYSMHMADAGTDQFDRDFALSVLSSEQDALFEIDQALKRIEDGTYGICELTEEAISEERLEAIPWTRYSIEGQRQVEAQGSGRRAHLGQVGSVASRAGDEEGGEGGEEEE